MANVSNMDDMIDSRNVIARIDELENEGEDLKENPDNHSPLCSALGEEDEDFDKEECDCQISNDDGLDESEREELTVLKALAEEAGGSPDWQHGEALIRDSYFEDYARELADDIGAINSDQNWPNYCIDWKQAARDLKVDYTSVEFDGIDYWIRS